MELTKINQLLSDLQSFNSKLLTIIERVDVDTPIDSSYNPLQGGENTYYKIFKIVDEKDLYLKVLYYTDSYGDGEFIRSVAFVKPKQVQKVEYINI